MGAIAREPSMEDILASIRKIVSQDAAAAPSGPPAAVTMRTEQAEPARPATAPKASASANGAAATQPAGRQSFADFARNITGGENGENGIGNKADASESPLKPALISRPAAAANGAARPPSLSGLLKSVRESWPQQGAVSDAGSRPQAAPAAQSAPTPRQDPFGGEMPALERRVAQNTEKPSLERRSQPVSSAGSAQAVARKEVAAEPAAEAAKFKDALVSPGTQQSVGSSLERLKQGLASGLDAKVEALLRPLLKDWLDENLPAMVEKMVRGEIDRIVREAEHKK